MHLWRFVASRGHLVAVSSEMPHMDWLTSQPQAAIAQLGGRQTEDLQVPGSRQIFHCGKKGQNSEQCSEAAPQTAVHTKQSADSAVV